MTHELHVAEPDAPPAPGDRKPEAPFGEREAVSS
jgi:hypothetical protein